MRKNSFYFITHNTFNLIPPVKQIYDALFEEYQIYTVQCEIESLDSVFQKKNNYTINTYENYNELINSSLYHKVRKYIITFLLFIFLIPKNKRKHKRNILYFQDLYPLFLGILFKKKKDYIIYHQFEIITTQNLNRFDNLLLKKIIRKLDKIDLYIFPEENRRNLFIKDYSFSSNVKTLIIPNTNNNFNKVQFNLNEKIIVSHVGSLGNTFHHLEAYLDVIEKLPKNEFEFWFIGFLSENIKNIIESRNLINVKLIGQLKHSMLVDYYFKTDIGIILYNDKSLDTKFCAPNKLYEFWSYGVPVIGDKLPGLESVFLKNIQGVLINMNNQVEFLNAFNGFIVNDFQRKEKLIRFFNKNNKLDVYIKNFKEALI
ncbi:MAG: glycosyltransferase [Algoriphagus sp.]|nr:glycosyltransferase [Algoriphagus sp.]